MLNTEQLLERAIAHHGSLTAVEEQLAYPKPEQALREMGDDRYLAEMSAGIFRAGFVWRVIAQKWDGFEEVFNGFMPMWVASRSPEQIEAIAQDTRIVRNYTKVKAVQENALFVLDIAREHGSFGNFIADWPSEDLVGLWAYLKKHGCRLGGNTGQYFLRFCGKDSFILSRDVCRVLLNEEVISKNNPTSQKDFKAAQAFFNELHQESGRSYSELSRLVALSIGPDDR